MLQTARLQGLLQLLQGAILTPEMANEKVSVA